jgi:uncharacterized membrane protein HdeD (DUF308 family)
VKHFLIYTALRVGLFLATWAVVAGVATVTFGKSTEVGIWSLVAAAVISSILSLKLLAGPRERFARSVQGRAERASARLQEMKSAEDVD